ncbi:MAG TPA: prolyl oligopeptidase family serine peptidase, partial [Polyangiales bacterium]
NAPLPDELARLNAQLRGATTETIGGQRVEDPFRALEHDDAATRAWLDAQSARTERELSARRDPKAEQRLRELLSIGVLSDLAVGGGRVFFSLREGGRERAALYMLDSAGRGTLPDQPLIDPRSYGERAAIDYVFPSQDGRYLAFGVSANGDERATLRVFDVDAKRALPDAIEHAKWSAVDWLNDGSGFYYRRYPKPGEPDWNEAEPDSYFGRLFVHRLGQPDADDALLFAGDKPADFPGATSDEDGRFVAIANERSWTQTDLYLWDRGANPSARAPAPKPGELRAIVTGEDHSNHGSVLRGQLYLLTNLDAPNGRMVRVPAASAADRKQWQTVVPETTAAIDDAIMTRDFIVVHRIVDVHSKLELFTQDGQARGEIALPGPGSIDALHGTIENNRIAFIWNSLLHAPTLFSYDLDQQQLQRLYQVQTDFDASRYQLQQVKVQSADGTPVNVYYVERRGSAHDRQTPVLLTGYGGFDVSLLPSFSRSAIYFLEQGGIFAQANLRGGGEFGDSFHRDGMLKNKQRVFEDFEAVIRWFSSSGISNPNRIAITGGSNGGLLIGAMITRAPGTFAAAASYVGLYDMLRYPLFPPASVWISEYGDPNDPDIAAYLRSYSPYHNVRDHSVYPAVLIETADHDTRVFWGHSAKFAARLQSANAGDKPIYFYMQRAVGHGHGSGVSDQVERYARQYAFLRAALDMR